MRSHRMPSRSLIALVTVMLLVGQTSVVAPSTAANPQPAPPSDEKRAPLSGVVEFREMNFGTGLTECPQAGLNPDPALDRRTKDRVEQLSQGGDDIRANPEYSCFPQNETSIAVNPTNARNIVAGANDYRLGWATSGFYASTNGGQSWYTGLIPFPSLPNGDNLDGGGDPALVFDRSGVVYYADINFNRTDDTNGVFVSRSTNGGYTWSRPCVPISVGTPSDDLARCGAPGDPRQPGDGIVAFQTDNNGSADFSVTFHDKEYIGAGPRPAGVTPVCFAPETKTPIPAGALGCPESTIGVDRLYVSWTAFNNPVGIPGFITSSTIELSFSDDMGRSWSARRTVNGSAPFCIGAFAGGTHCDDNQFSVPTVSRHTGHLYIAFENFDTPDENQWLLVRSRDGGATFEGPFFVTPVFDLNLRLRAECIARGAARVHLTNSCFRVPYTGAVVVDKRDGLFADDLYLVMSDNRNGTRDSTNTDVFLFKSLDGGSTWIGPTRVNDDPSTQPANRNCGRSGQAPCPAGVHTGNDQWWPWVDIGERGDLNVAFHDRRLDTDSVASEWPTSRTRPGNYLVWFWGGQCRVTTADSRECVAPTAALIPQPTAPINPGNELFPVQTEFPLGNFTISDTPSNFDYSFRAGIFAGDYSGMAIGPDNQAWAAFTDARNGRSSRTQSGRNPACEQSDIFVDAYSAVSGGTAAKAQASDELYLVVPCPEDAADPGNRP